MVAGIPMIYEIKMINSGDQAFAMEQLWFLGGLRFLLWLSFLPLTIVDDDVGDTTGRAWRD